MYYRLKELRLDNELLQKDLAKILNISEITYTHYESEYYIMPLKYLIILCDYFNASLDYIFSFTNEKNYNNIIANYNLNNIKVRLKEFRKENKITQKKLAEMLNTTFSTISSYECGINIISTNYLYTICQKYNISADYLLGRTDKNNIKN